MKTLQRGFTLIELLVVIAIIGILSSIVLASLSSARDKGTDAAISSSLSSLRAQAELWYSNNNAYNDGSVSTACTTGIFNSTATGGMKTLIADITTKAGGTSNVACFSATSSYIVTAKLKGTGYWCSDSTGNSVSTTSAATVNGPCK